MRILLSLSLLATLLLSACGTGEKGDSSSSLDSMFGGDETEVKTDSTATVELPTSEGPSEAPLVQTTPNE